MFRRLKDVPECFGSIDGLDCEADIPVRITTHPKLRQDVITMIADDDPKTISLEKEYHIHKVTGYGDVFDVTIINDLGEEEELSEWFFEDID